MNKTGPERAYSDDELRLLLEKAGASTDIYGVYGLFYGCQSAPKEVLPTDLIACILGKNSQLSDKDDQFFHLASMLMFLRNALEKWDPEKNAFFFPKFEYKRTNAGLRQKASDYYSFVTHMMKGLQMGDAKETDYSPEGKKALESMIRIQGLLEKYLAVINPDDEDDDEAIGKSFESMDRLMEYLDQALTEVNLGLLESRKAGLGKTTSRKERNIVPSQAKSSKIGRNDPCTCGSGRKYKKCCGQAASKP